MMGNMEESRPTENAGESQGEDLNEMQIRAVVVDGTTYELQLTQNVSGTWSAFGLLAGGGGSVVSGCQTADVAVEVWIRGIPKQE